MSSRRLSRQTFDSDSEDEFASASEGGFESMDELDEDNQHEHDTNNAHSPSATNPSLSTSHSRATPAIPSSPRAQPAPAPAAPAPAPVPAVEKSPSIQPQPPVAAVVEQPARQSHESSVSIPPASSGAGDSNTGSPAHPSSSSTPHQPAQRSIADSPSKDSRPSVVGSSTVVNNQASPFPSSQQRPLQSTPPSSSSADRSGQEYLDRLFGPPPPSAQHGQTPLPFRPASAQSDSSSFTTANTAAPSNSNQAPRHLNSQTALRSNGSTIGDQSHLKQQQQQQQQQQHSPPSQPRSQFDQRGQPQKEQKGWGSLSSWLNTAVSTVSEVIENPNVVVSKAQTISKGIRTVASEQIDRVYESLDPEYEYERERAQKTGQPNTTAHGLRDARELQGNAAGTPSRLSQDDSGRAHQDNNLQQPPIAAKPEKDVRSLSLFNSPPQKQDVSLSSLLPSLSVVAQDTPKDAAAATAGKDGWGDDGWGDQWDDIDSIASSQDGKSKPAATTTVGSGGQHTTPSIHQQLPPRPPSQGQRRNQLEVPTPTTYQEAILGRHGNQGQQRRPSAEIRPAEAIFSTLDFASNALGNAVLGVHRKVTQANQNKHLGGTFGGSGGVAHAGSSGLSTPASSSSGRTSPLPNASNPSSPELTNTSGSMHGSTPSGQQRTSGGPPSSERKGGVRLNPVDIVGGNVVSTGLGALESLGKKAVDVIADVRRAGNQGGRGGLGSQFEYPDDMARFKIPPKMEIKIMFGETNGPTHLATLSSIASSAQARFMDITSTKLQLFEMAELEQVEKMLSPQQLQDCIEETQVDLLASHKDFRAIVALLENMGVQGTTILRHLRNSTRKLGTLPQDTVNAFEQEWFNHQSRASEKDFFAKVPIKRFFETRLMNVYFDGLKAVVQFSEKSCEQVLRLAENFNIRVAEKSGQGNPAARKDQENGSSSSSSDIDPYKLSPIDLAKILRAFLGKILSEARFVAWTYGQCMDAILQAAKGFTTPLQGLDWDELLAGVIKLKRQLMETDHVVATEYICKGAGSIVEIFKYELGMDVVQGRLKPTFLPKKAAPKPIVAPQHPVAGAPAPTTRTLPPSSSSAPSTATPLPQPSSTPSSGASSPRKPVFMAKTSSASSLTQPQPSLPSTSMPSALPEPKDAVLQATPLGMPRRPSTPAAAAPPRAKTPVSSTVASNQSVNTAQPPLPSPTMASFSNTTAPVGSAIPPRAKTPLGSKSPEMARPPLPPATGAGSPSMTLRSKSSSTSLSFNNNNNNMTSFTSTTSSTAGSLPASVTSSPSMSPMASPKPSSRVIPIGAAAAGATTTPRKMSLGARRIPANVGAAGESSPTSSLSMEPVPATPPLPAAIGSSVGPRAVTSAPTPSSSAASSLVPSPSGSLRMKPPSSAQQQQQQPAAAIKGKVVGTPIARPPPPKKVPLSVQKKMEDDDFFSILDKK
ncbi:hypothetical protein BGW41_001574 [Actinomortierella wolfii]|nr:hypothetical protein BGW41_001574 [Actinomortierella wolfii]